MTTLAANFNRAFRPAIQQQFEIADTIVLFAGSMVALLDGRVLIFTDAAGQIPLGIAKSGGTGDTSATPPPTIEVDLGPFILRDEVVTGASAITDVESIVFLTASDDNLLTLTAPTLGARVIPFGTIIRFNSPTSFDIYVHPFGQKFFTSPSAAYSTTNAMTDRAFDADAVVITELADVVATLIADLQARTILG